MPKVLLTRPHIRTSSSDEIHRVLGEAGIIIEELPMLRFDWPPDLSLLDRAFARAADGQFNIIILSSPTAVNFFEERARELGLLDSIAKLEFGAVGRATAEELAKIGI